ncbi:hypothetical protein [Paenimyroides ceti]
MKKLLFLMALGFFMSLNALAASPIGSGSTPCGGNASIRHFFYTNFWAGEKTYYGPYYYFNSLEDASSYIIQTYPPVHLPNVPSGGATVMCYMVVTPPVCCP